MHRSTWKRGLICAVLSVLLSVSSVGNLITGYDLPVTSMSAIWLGSVFCAAVLPWILTRRHRGIILAFLGAGLLYILWKAEGFLPQIQYLGYILSFHYHEVYAWPVLGSIAADHVTGPILLWAILVSVCVNLHTCRRKHIAVALVPTVLPLVLCLITNDRVPDERYLYLMILVLSALFLTDWTRRHQPEQGMGLTAKMILPLAVSLALLFAWNPRTEYVNKAADFQHNAISLFQELLDTGEAFVNGELLESASNEKLNLKYVGPKSKVTHAVMRVKSPVGGTVYLRGRDYDRYTGTGWEATATRRESIPSGSSSVGNLSIVTYGVRDVLYVPYYPTREVLLAGGACGNEGNVQQYSYAVSLNPSGCDDPPDLRYTQLPDETGLWATRLLERITEKYASEQQIVSQIREYVRNCATYDLSTLRMDGTYSDFARWFLEESETGYCVHFATAATVLLRAANIPARYVEGYMVRCSLEADVVVSNQDAHAWVEYYDSDRGYWSILEATPADPQENAADETFAIPETETSMMPTETEKPPAIPENTETLPEESAAETPADSDESPDHRTDDEKDSSVVKISDWIRTLLKLLLVLACLPLQGYVRIYRKRIAWNHGRANERAIERWKQTRYLAKVMKQPYPEVLDHLAYKAKFSQHIIRPEELEQFDLYRSSVLQLLQSKHKHQMLFYKWILAIA